MNDRGPNDQSRVNAGPDRLEQDIAAIEEFDAARGRPPIDNDEIIFEEPGHDRTSDTRTIGGTIGPSDRANSDLHSNGHDREKRTDSNLAFDAAQGTTNFSHRYLDYMGLLYDPWLVQQRSENERSNALDDRRTARLKEVAGKRLQSNENELAKAQVVVEIARERNNLSRQIFMEREHLTAALANCRLPSYREYLQAIAKNDPAAAAELDALDRRKALELDNQPQYDYPDWQTPFCERQLSRITTVQTDEGLLHTLPSGQSFTDTGTQIDIPTNDEHAIRAALLISREKWPDGITITGSPGFKSALLREAARIGLKVANPELQQQYLQFSERFAEQKQTVRMHHSAYMRTSLTKDLVFYPTAEEHQRVFQRDILPNAAVTASVAAHRDYKIASELTRDGERMKGILDEGWVLQDQGFALLKATLGYRVLAVSPQAVRAATSQYDQKVEMIKRDGKLTIEPQRERSMERERILV